jgi:hypothetical protein
MMLGLTPVQTPPYVAPPPPIPPVISEYDRQQLQNLNEQFPNAIEGDGVIYIGPGDGPEVWVKVKGGWMQGLYPGSHNLTGEYIPEPKRIIFNAFSRGDPRLVGTDMTKSSGVGTGHIVLLGLLALYLLRGSAQ